MSNTAFIVYSNEKPIFIPPIPRPDPLPVGWREATPKNAFDAIVSEYKRGVVPPSELLTIVQSHFDHLDADVPQTTPILGNCDIRITGQTILDIRKWLCSRNYHSGTFDVVGDNISGVVMLWITEENLRVNFEYAYIAGKFTMNLHLHPCKM